MTQLIGVFDLLDEASQTVLRAYSETAVIERDGEAINADLHTTRSRLKEAATRVLV